MDKRMKYRKRKSNEWFPNIREVFEKEKVWVRLPSLAIDYLG